MCICPYFMRMFGLVIKHREYPTACQWFVPVIKYQALLKLKFIILQKMGKEILETLR